MSNTGRSKRLASFNCDEELWERFRHRCQEKGTTATATLTQFIKLYLDGSLDNLDAIPGKTLDESLDKQIKASVDEYLNKCLPSQIDKYLAASYLSNNPRTNTNLTKPIKEREYWFIQERAKHLGLRLSADQFLRVDMFAAAAYKERHGRPPGTRLFRGNQAPAYPAADVDLLDKTIRGVLAQEQGGVTRSK